MSSTSWDAGYGDAQYWRALLAADPLADEPLDPPRRSRAAARLIAMPEDEGVEDQLEHVRSLLTAAAVETQQQAQNAIRAIRAIHTAPLPAPDFKRYVPGMESARSAMHGYSESVAPRVEPAAPPRPPPAPQVSPLAATVAHGQPDHRTAYLQRELDKLIKSEAVVEAEADAIRARALAALKTKMAPRSRGRSPSVTAGGSGAPARSKSPLDAAASSSDPAMQRVLRMHRAHMPRQLMELQQHLLDKYADDDTPPEDDAHATAAPVRPRTAATAASEGVAAWATDPGGDDEDSLGWQAAASEEVEPAPKPDTHISAARAAAASAAMRASAHDRLGGTASRIPRKKPVMRKSVDGAATASDAPAAQRDLSLRGVAARPPVISAAATGAANAGVRPASRAGRAPAGVSPRRSVTSEASQWSTKARRDSAAAEGVRSDGSAAVVALVGKGSQRRPKAGASGAIVR